MLKKKLSEENLDEMNQFKTLQDLSEKAFKMGGEQKIKKQHSLGRLTARERIQKLLDKNSFQEIGLLNHSEIPEMREKTPADGKIGGFGTIRQQTVGLTADDATVLAGAGGIVGYTKEMKIHHFAQSKGFPIIHLGDAGGARIPDIMGAVGNIRFAYPITSTPRNRSVLAITAIMGECFGGPTWQAAVSDIVIQVKGSKMAVVGKSILESANNDQTSAEVLGNWEMHAFTTGSVDLIAENDIEAIHLIQKTLTYFPSHAEELPPIIDFQAPSIFKQKGILNLLPKDNRYAYDMHELLQCIFDKDSFLELKPFYDGSLIITFARLEGQVVGVLASNPKVNAGAMGVGACEKAMSFIILCDSFHIPLIFLHDTPGFYTSKLAEEQRIPNKIMNLLNALQYSTVPKITLYVRRSYGMASHALMGAKMGGDFVMAWPNAEISFTAPEVAFNVVLGRKIKEHPNPEDLKTQFMQELASMNAPWEAAGLGFIDKIIDPRKTRDELIQALKLAKGKSGGKSKRLMASWNKL